MYQESDDLDSLNSESEDDNDEKNSRKRKRGVKHQRYHSTSSSDLKAGMTFRDKKQLKEATENYRIIGGYHLKIKKSGKSRLTVFCLGEGCKWRLWASKMTNEASFQVRKMDAPHTRIPFSFEPGKRHMSCDWLANTYRETFILQPPLRAVSLRTIVKDRHIYNATLCMCSRARRKALDSIIGDYRG